MSEAHFVILREDHQNFVPLGHVARPLTIEEARIEAASLAKRYPDCIFHVFADCGAAVHHDSVAMELTVPSLSSAVVPLRNLMSGSC